MSDSQQSSDQQQPPFEGAPPRAPGVSPPPPPGVNWIRIILLALLSLVVLVAVVAVAPLFVEIVDSGVELIRSVLSLSNRPLFYDKDYRLGALAMVLIAAVAGIKILSRR